MARNLFVVTLGMDLSQAGATRQAIDPMPLKNARDSRVRDLDVVVSCQVPNDPHRAEMVLASQMKNLLLNLNWCAIGMPLWDWWLVDQRFFTAFPIGRPPSVEAAATNPEIPTGFGGITNLFSVP
jgi:hypothetical protein